MFTAQILNQDGKIIDAEDYEKNPQDDLCCPDPSCSAAMIHVSASQELAAFDRATHFRTKKGHKHEDGCEAHREEKEFKRRMDSICEAIEKGHKVLLSLNDVETKYGLPRNLGRDFNSQSDPAFKKTELYDFKVRYRGRHSQQSVRKIRTLMTMITMIDKKFGPPAFTNVHFTWQGQVKSYVDCVCDGKDDSLQLARDLYEESKNVQNPYRFDAYGQVGAYGFPRFIEFTPSAAGRSNGKVILFGDEFQLDYDPNHKNRLFLKHAIDVGKLDEEGRKRILNGQPVRLIATPKVNRTKIDEAVQDFRAGKNASVRLTWSVCGGHQVQSLSPSPERVMSRPLPARARKVPGGTQLALL